MFWTTTRSCAQAFKLARSWWQLRSRPLTRTAAIAANFADDLAQGAFLIAVPYIPKAGKPVRVNISLGRGTLEAIDHAAAARDLKRSAWLVQAARNEITMAR